MQPQVPVPKMRRASAVVVSTPATANAANCYGSATAIIHPSRRWFSRQHLRMSQPLPPVAPKAMMASSAFSVLSGSAQSPAFPNGIPKGPKASHHSHGKAGGAKATGGGGAAAAQGVHAVHTHTAMGRWSILPKEPPSELGLHHLHIRSTVPLQSLTMFGGSSQSLMPSRQSTSTTLTILVRRTHPSYYGHSGLVLTRFSQFSIQDPSSEP